MLLSLVGGILAATRQARLAEASRLRAERRFADVRALAGAFLFDFHDAIQDLPGATWEAARDHLRHGLVEWNTLARTGGLQPDGQAEAEADAARVLLAECERVLAR